MAQDITRVYRQCNPARPLEPGDSRYVPFTGVRGRGDLVMRLANSIHRADEPLHLLFAGHRGGGKSTELLRLKQSLAEPKENSKGSFVVYFEADEEDVDVNDVDFPDLLLAIIRQVGKALREGPPKVELRPTRLSGFIDNVKHLLGTEVEFEKLDLDAKIAKITATIKSSPNARHEIRRALEPNVSNLLSAANDLLDEAETRLRAQGYENLVLIVDNLDRIVLRQLPDSQFNTHEQLFINRGAQLAEIRCHVIYTLPISMVFSPKATAFQNIFGRRPDVLPMVEVIGRDGKDNPAGMEKMRDMVQRRFEVASVGMDAAFDAPSTLDDLCRMSGGHVRNLLILLRSACDWLDDLPITQDAVGEAVQGLCNDFERALSDPEFFKVLHQIEQSKDLPGSAHDQMLLYNLSVLEYSDENPRYAVNPAVRTLDKFKKAVGSAKSSRSR